MNNGQTLIPIYTTRGDPGAFLVYPYLFDRNGDWIGWVAPDRGVYSIRGHYVGWLSKDPRILRKRAESYDHPMVAPPPPPNHVYPPSMVPLAPLMPELSFGVLDVLEEQPELLPTLDFGELSQDLD